MHTSNPFQEPGRFEIGCNYWAPYAGTRMWSDWRPREIARDLDVLASHGLTLVRVFPLWPDFQPIQALTTYHGQRRDTRIDEAPLPDTDIGQAGVDPVMLDRFAEFADLAAQRGIRLIVGLVTGWMSSRMFVPPALEGLNVLTDPVALMWETRFVRAFVDRFKGHRAVAAWDLGNECNCMAAASREAAWAWTALISQTIRSVDPTRPVVSGMHSLPVEPEQPWSIHDQAELTDVLTTHPYPAFTPYCGQDPIHSLRTSLHATAETRLYADIGGRPAMAEEIGALGRMICSEATEAAMARVNLFSLWANDCRAFLWWCAFDLNRQAHAPYDWDAIERDLGLFTAARKPKPIVTALQDFRSFLRAFPVKRLPPRQTDAVCILTRGQDSWGTAYSTFVLAKQAGFDIAFQHAEQPLRDAKLYLLPSVHGSQPITRHRWLALLDRVRRGAELYISLDDVHLSPFCEEAGIRIESRRRRTGPAAVTFEADVACPPLSLTGDTRYDIRVTHARAQGSEADGNPVFTEAVYGKGRIRILAFPLEARLAQIPGAFAPDATPYRNLYRYIAGNVLNSRVVTRDSATVVATEHILDTRTRVVVVVNHEAMQAPVDLSIRKPWKIRKAWRGVLSGTTCTVPAHDAAVLMLGR